MSDPTLALNQGNQLESPATNLQNVATGTANTQSISTNSFWTSFHVFSCQFEKWCVRHWHWLLCLFFGTLLCTYIFIDVAVSIYSINHHLYYNVYQWSYGDLWRYVFSSKSYTGKFLLSWWYNLFVIGMFLVLPIFYAWQDSIPSIFQILQQKYIIFGSQGSTTSREEFQQFLDQYQYELLHGRKRLLWGKLLVTRAFVTWGVMLVTIVILLSWWIWGNSQALGDDATQYNIFVAALFGLINVVRETLYILLLVYLAVQILWILTVTGIYLAKLTGHFELLVQPAHIDHCGGLKFLGDFSLHMALLILMVSVLLAFYSTSEGFSFWSVGTSIILVLVLLLAYFVFFMPLKEIHQQMLKARSSYDEVLVASTTKAAEKLRLALSEGDSTKIKIAKEEFDMMQTLHPEKIGYVTWPISRSTLIAFFVPQIVPAISFIVGISPSLSEALKGVLSIFPGGK